jgi:hypothetical protein
LPHDIVLIPVFVALALEQVVFPLQALVCVVVKAKSKHVEQLMQEPY